MEMPTARWPPKTSTSVVAAYTSVIMTTKALCYDGEPHSWTLAADHLKRLVRLAQLEGSVERNIVVIIRMIQGSLP